MPPTRHRPTHRPARHRVQRTTGPLALEDRALDLLDLRLPASDHALRTQSPILRRVPLTRGEPHVLQTTRETHQMRHRLSVSHGDVGCSVNRYPHISQRFTSDA